MTRDEFLDELGRLEVAEDDVVYLERRGDAYRWGFEGPRNHRDDDVVPDAWIYYTGRWPTSGLARGPFLDDLLSEMDSMVSSDDRCRWPLDDPWPHAH